MKTKINFLTGCLCAVAILIQISGCDTANEYEYEKSIYVAASSLTMYVGEEFQLVANPTGNSFEWTSGNAGIASVSSTGLVKAVALGETNVTVSQGGLKKEISVTVIVPVAKKISLEQKGRLGARLTMEFQNSFVKTVTVKYGDASKVVNISLQSGVFQTDFDWLPDGLNILTLVYADNFGNETSATVSVTMNHPKSRAIRMATAFGNGTVITWQDKVGDYCNVSYTNAAGVAESKRVPASENTTYIYGKNLRYSTTYLADAIDPVDFTTAESGFSFTDKSSTLSSAKSCEIQARDFDLGGEGAGFHDSNNGPEGSYRSGLGDLNSSKVTVEGGLGIGYGARDEWLMFTVEVANAGKYAIDYNITVNSGGVKTTFEVDGSWSDYKWYFGERHQAETPPSVTLTAGTHKLKFIYATDGFNIMGFKFTYIGN